MYRALFKHGFARLDAEVAHQLVYVLISWVGRVAPLRAVVRALFARGLARGPSPASGLGSAATRAFGRDLAGPLGVAAGLDKDGRAVLGLLALGFSHVEVGTVTALAQPGNPKPRLWRHLPERAIRNQMGFNNQGASRVARRLAALRRSAAGGRAVVGVNIGKSRRTPLAQAPADYKTSARLLAAHADYLVVNVSSPNTPGLRDLQSVDALRPILAAAREGAAQASGVGRPGPVPLLVKIAPDLADEDIDAIADLVCDLDLDGVVAVNTTIDHGFGPGGLSGPPLLARGVEVVARLRARLGPAKTLIGVGGIATVEDARAYLDAGATLVQAYTGFIYEGPAWPGRVNRALS